MKKDGNPLNEVRVLCTSMKIYDSIMTVDKSMKLAPERSVLKHQFGETIALREKDFALISAAFFAEIESKYL